MERKLTTVRITDRTCVDCGGPVTLFLVPDKVWDQLGYEVDAFACLACVGRRLNPHLKTFDAESISVEMYRRRKRFKLKTINRYGGVELPLCSVVVRVANEKSEESLTAEEAGGRATKTCGQQTEKSRAD